MSERLTAGERFRRDLARDGWRYLLKSAVTMLLFVLCLGYVIFYVYAAWRYHQGNPLLEAR